ncbi:MAG: putative zinc-finger [Actinomycetota bacterium]|nr:putative zinc-finger [Actinomycetota bacterium]
MKSELRCEDVRPELSAYLDGELDPATSEGVESHLVTCSECRLQEKRIRRVRQLARVQPSAEVPDLVAPIMERIATRGNASVHRFPPVRTAGIAAAAAALIVLGASLPWSDDPPDTARATEIVSGVRAAARDLTTFHARFRLTERGWHPDVDIRRFRAEVWFAAPERFRLEVHDVTSYPSTDWPHNDVELSANARRYRISEPSTCPVDALPSCAPSVPTEQRTVINRQPFDGNSRLPTDIAIPLETLASSDGVQVLSTTRFLGTDVQRVVLPYRQAVPLVASLQAGGSWREFHPLDPVEVWIDPDTWFPLRFIVRAGDSPDRRLWASRMGAAGDRPGDVLFDASATEFDEPTELPAATFKSRVAGAVQDGGFKSVDELDPVTPGFTAGLRPYRSGITPFGQTVVTYTRGMNYLKVSNDPRIRSTLVYGGPAEAITLGNGEVLFQPASERSGRRIDIFGPDGHIALETNLPRAQLIEIATSLNVRGRLPARVRTNGGQVVRRLKPGTEERPPFALAPTWMPVGFENTSTLLTRSATGTSLTTYYQRPESSFGGFGIRIVQTPAIKTLPPVSEEVVNVRVGSYSARWSFERSELEWIADGVYRAVATPDGDLASAVLIARGLR